MTCTIRRLQYMHQIHYNVIVIVIINIVVKLIIGT